MARRGDEARIRSWSALSKTSDTTHQAHRCGTGRGEGPEPAGEMINDPVNYTFRHLCLVLEERPGTSVFCSTQTLHRANREPLDRHAFPAALLRPALKAAPISPLMTAIDPEQLQPVVEQRAARDHAGTERHPEAATRG